MTDEEKKPSGPQIAEQEPWDGKAELDHWKEEYDSLTDQLKNLSPDTDVLGELENLQPMEAPPGVENRRQQPRYSFMSREGAEIFAHMGPRAFRIQNISVTGVAFHSDTPFQPGTNLLLSALGMVALDVDVVACDMMETDSVFMEFSYLVRARFSERVNGYLVYVLSREMYLKQLQGK